jgi:hypothetical protein
LGSVRIVMLGGGFGGVATARDLGTPTDWVNACMKRDGDKAAILASVSAAGVTDRRITVSRSRTSIDLNPRASYMDRGPRKWPASLPSGVL